MGKAILVEDILASFSSYSPKSNSHFSLSDCEEKRPRECRENINNGEIITIFLSVKMSISKKAHTTCEYEMFLLKSFRRPQ